MRVTEQPLRWLGLLPHPPRTGVAYVGVRVVVYVVALVLTVLVYGTKERGLFIAPPVGLFAAAGTWYFLGDTPVGRAPPGGARGRSRIPAG